MNYFHFRFCDKDLNLLTTTMVISLGLAWKNDTHRKRTIDISTIKYIINLQVKFNRAFHSYLAFENHVLVQVEV